MASVGCCLPASPSQAEVMAVVGARLDPYMQALGGMREALGHEVPFRVSGEGKIAPDPKTRVVVTIGGRAAMDTDVPGSLAVVRCLAPGLEAPRPRSSSRIVEVHMLPRPATMMASLLEIQPQLKRLSVFWISEGMAEYTRKLAAEGATLGVHVELVRLKQATDLPAALRQGLRQSPQAIWMPPDPMIVNRESFAVLRAFCRGNRIVLYAPSDGLVEMGAVASVASSFREIGRVAGIAVRELLSGGVADPDVYPERTGLSINVSAAEACGLQLAPSVLRRAKTYP